MILEIGQISGRNEQSVNCISNKSVNLHVHFQLAAFAITVMSHMNDDYEDVLVAMVKHYTGISCLIAQITSIDKHGM